MTLRSAHVALVAGPSRGQRGFSLMEAIVATAIAVIAILGLAHSFSLGRGFIARYEVGRAALGEAQGRMEGFTVLRPADLVPGTADSVAFSYRGAPVGFSFWRIVWVDDSADGLGGADLDGDTNDLKRVTVTVRWTDGQRVELARLFPAD